MKKLTEIYSFLFNNISKLFINNDIVDLINLIDDIGYENFIIKYIYNEIKMNQNKDTLTEKLYEISRDNITTNFITNFIFDNICRLKINKLALYGFISMNEYDIKIKNIFKYDFKYDIDIILIYLNKIYTDYILEQMKDFIKFYLSLFDIELISDNFDENLKKCINIIQINQKEYIDKIKIMNNNYNDDIKLLNKSLFNIRK